MVKRSFLSPPLFTLAYDLPWLKIKIRVRMLAASFCSFFWDLGGHEKSNKKYAKHPYKELSGIWFIVSHLSEANQGGF